MIRAMIFDLDGTLVQTERLKSLSYARAAVELCPHPVTEEEVIRVFSSGGTTGNPTFYGISQKDWDRGAEAMALFAWTVGIRPHDTVYYCIPFGVWVGSWGYLHGIDKIGARQITAGFVPTERHIGLIKKKPVWQVTNVESTIFCPNMYPDNVAWEFMIEASPLAREQFGGKDMFGIEW